MNKKMSFENLKRLVMEDDGETPIYSHNNEPPEHWDYGMDRETPMTMGDIYSNEKLPITFEHEITLTREQIRNGILEDFFVSDAVDAIQILDWALDVSDVPGCELNHLDVSVKFRYRDTSEGDEILEDTASIPLSIDPMDIRDEFCDRVRRLNLLADGPRPEDSVNRSFIDSEIRKHANAALFITDCEIESEDPYKLVVKIGYDPIHECDFLDDVVKQYWDLDGATYEEFLPESRQLVMEDANDNNKSRTESLKLTADYLLGQIRGLSDKVAKNDQDGAKLFFRNVGITLKDLVRQFEDFKNNF